MEENLKLQNMEWRFHCVGMQDVFLWGALYVTHVIELICHSLPVSIISKMSAVVRDENLSESGRPCMNSCPQWWNGHERVVWQRLMWSLNHGRGHMLLSHSWNCVFCSDEGISLWVENLHLNLIGHWTWDCRSEGTLTYPETTQYA